MTLCGYALVLGSFFSYGQSGHAPIALLGYVFAISALIIALLVTQKLSSIVAQRVSIFVFLFAIVTLLSALSNTAGSVSWIELGQALTYPATLGLLLLVGYRILHFAHRSLGWFIVFLASANCLVGLAGSAGFVSVAGPFGEVDQGRLIFGTNFRSSNGLALNVNYYAATQAALGFLYALFRSVKVPNVGRADWAIIGAILVSSLIGSSRGVTVGILASIIVVLVIDALGARNSVKWRARGLIVLSGLLVIVSTGVYWEEIYDIFRFARGLNMRDEIWAAVMVAWFERPWLGWGLETGSAMGLVTSGELEGRSAHSGYLHTLLRLGFVGVVVVYGGLLYFLWWSLNGNPTLVAENKLAWSCVVLYLANSMFRTYSFGGVGLLPLVGALAISVLIYRRKRSQQAPWQMGSQPVAAGGRVRSVGQLGP